MKKGKMIITALALSTATALYAGNGMGGTPCDGNGKGMQRGAGMGQGMMQGKQDRMHAQGMQKRHNRMERMMQRMQKKLNLTPEQREKIQKIMAEYRQQMQSEHQKRRGQGMGQGMQAQGMKGQGRGMGMQGQGKGMKRGMKAQRLRGMPLASVLGAEKFDKAAFAQAMEKRWARQDARRMERRRVMLEHLSDAMEKVHDVLTPEQRKKLLEWSQQKAR